jgi:hypothetical protein
MCKGAVVLMVVVLSMILLGCSRNGEQAPDTGGQTDTTKPPDISRVSEIGKVPEKAPASGALSKTDDQTEMKAPVSPSEVTEKRTEESEFDKFKALLDAFKKDPVGNYNAAYWFAKLPLGEKRKFAEKIGKILLTSPNSSDFAFGIGADKSPYPWVINCGEQTTVLSGENSFTLNYRDDKYVKGEWGTYWVAAQSYDTVLKGGVPIFIKQAVEKGQSGFDLWIPSSGWQYVGPSLERSARVLGHTPAPSPARLEDER